MPPLPMPCIRFQTQIEVKEESGDGGSVGGGRGTPGPPGSTEPAELVPRLEPRERSTRFGAGCDAGALEAAPPEAQPGSRSVEPGVGDTRLAEAITDGQLESHAEPRIPSTLNLVREQDGAGGEGRGTAVQNAEKIVAEGIGKTAALSGIEPEEQRNESSQQQQQRQRLSREADDLDLVPQVTARAGQYPPDEASATAPVTAGPATVTGSTVVAAVAEQRAAREFEESGGSLEGDSAHSRWSLPDNRGIGGIGAAGGLHEQRAVWAGGHEDDDSVDTVEQAPSSVESEGGGSEKDGKSPSRSRVESYDLQQESVRPTSSKFYVREHEKQM